MNPGSRGASRFRPLLFAILGLALSARPSMDAVASVDTSGDADLIVHPASPCTQDVVTVFVRGYVSTPCDSFVSAKKIDDGTIRIRTVVYSTRQCLVAPWQFFSVPVVMGQFPEGHQEIRVLRETIVRDEVGGRDTIRVASTLGFEVAPVCVPQTVPAVELPFVHTVKTVPSPPCPGSPVAVRLDGAFLDGCGTVAAVDPATFSLTLAPYPPVPQPCTMALKPWSVEFPLGALAAGHHTVTIHMTVLGTNSVWPPVPTQTYVGVFAFDVPLDCGGNNVLPYVDFIQVVPARPGAGVLCEGDSILVRVGGTLPSDCYQVGIEAFAPPYGSPLPMPSIVRLTVKDQGCSRRACGAAPVSFVRAVAIPPLPAGPYTLWVAEQTTLGCPPDSNSFQTGVPFTVVSSESCSVAPTQCLTAGWGGQSGSCSAFIAPGDSASIALWVRSPVALAGLEGRLRLTGQGASIVGIDLIQFRDRMVLQWTPTPEGAHFVLFATSGAPIPAHSPLDLAMTPVLRVTVGLAAVMPALYPPPTRLTLSTGWDLLGSDQDGHAVPMCGPAPWEFRLPPTAVFCVNGGECDVNRDGHLDVRDLVLLAHCAVDPTQCGDDSPRPDCDGNGWWELDDVLCCAAALLGQPFCSGCPADSVRDAPGLAVGFGVPRLSATGVEVPLRITGASLVGAARLRFRFPVENLVLAGIDGAPPWLEVHGTKGNELTIGLVRAAISIPRLEGPPLELTLRWTRQTGRPLSGTLSLLDAEWSGADGVKLVADVGAPVVTFGGEGAVQMTTARPNPFEVSTRFSVQLERPGWLDVGVYDLAGRRVATLFDGWALAGARSFTWNGVTDEGRQARGGVYFLRARAGEQAVSRRVILVRGR